MWCDLKDTKYGDRLSKQLGVNNTKQFAMGIEAQRFKEWFGNGKTIKLENGEIVPFVNPIMQVINEKGKAFNLLERFKFQNQNEVKQFFNTPYTPGISIKNDVYTIENDDNRLINTKLIDEINRIYPDLLIKPGNSFIINNQYSFTPENKLFSKTDDLVAQAISASNDIKGVYKEIFQSSPEEVLFEAAIQANSSNSEKIGAIATFGEKIVQIAQQLFPTAKVGDSFALYQKAQINQELSKLDDKTKTLLDKLSLRFNIPYTIVNNPNANWKGFFTTSGITINSAKITADTPFHEFLHPFILALKSQNTALYNSLVQELNNTKSGIDIVQQVARLYPELSTEQLNDESLVTYLGKLSEAKYNVPSSPFNRFVKWLKSLFKKINIDFSLLSLNSTLSDISDLIVDDIFVADLKATAEHAGALIRYSRSDTDLTYNTLFERVKDRVAILKATVKNRKVGDQFKDDIEELDNIIRNSDEITSINNFVVNAISYVDAASRRFESLRESVKKANTLSKSDISYNLYQLGEIQQLLNVYQTLDDVKSLYIREGMTSSDDIMAKLRDAIDQKNLIIEDFKSFALTYTTEWLFPYIESTNKLLEAQGNIDDVITKEQFRDQMKVALSDISTVGAWLGATINSKDPISAAIGLALKDIVYNNHVKDIKIKNELEAEYKKVKGTSLYTTKTDEDDFNLQFLREAQVREQIGVDENDNPIYGYVNRLAFHTPFLDDQYDKARSEMYNSIGERPNRSDRQAYRRWQQTVSKWYADNTQLNPNVENIIENKRNTLSKRQFERWLLDNTKEVDNDVYATGVRKSDFFGNKVYSINNTKNTFRIYTGVLVQPSARYRNPEFNAKMSDPYYKKLYNAYQESNEKLGNFSLKYGIIPQVSKGKNLFSDLEWKKGAKENLRVLKTNLGRGIKADFDESRTVQRQDGTEVKNIPVSYTGMLQRSDLNINLLEGVLKFSQMANNYEGMTEIEPNILVLKTILNGDFNLGIKGRDIAKTNSKGKQVMNAITGKVVPKMAQQDMLNKRLNEFINDVVYGDDAFKETINVLGNDISLNKISDNVAFLTAMQNMALNFTGSINNVILGNFNNSIESFGGRFWTKKDWAFAHKEYFSNMHEFLGEIAGAGTSALNNIAEHYDVPQGEFQDQYGDTVSGGKVNKLMKTSSLFFLQKGGEHEIQLTGMMSLMHSTIIKNNAGNDVNLYNAWRKADSNFETLKQQNQWTDAQDAQFRNRLHAITKNLQGIYNKFDKSMLQRRWYGKLAIMFRKYLFSSFKARYGSKYIDYELGTIQEGYWNTFAKKFYAEAKEYKFAMFQRMWTKEGYDEIQKAAFNKTIYELSVILAAFLLAGIANDDEEKNWLTAETTLQITRMSADITQYLNPSDFIRVVRNPAASVNMIEKWLGWFSQLTNPTEEYDRASGIAKQGDNKLYIKTLKLLPVIRQVINFMTPEEQLKFYQLTGRN